MDEITVSLFVSPWETYKEIRRRKTGYSNADDTILEEFDDGYEEDHEQNEQETVRVTKVSIFVPQEGSATHHKIWRRQTGLVTIPDLKRIRETVPPEVDEQDEDLKDEKLKVRIAEQSIAHKWNVCTSGKTRARAGSWQGDDHAHCRPSVLVRLYDDVAIDHNDENPTLKENRLKGRRNTNDMLLSQSKCLLSKSQRLSCDDRRRGSETEIRLAQSSSTAINYHKRPKISVSAYRMKNLLYAEKLKQEQAKKKKEEENLPRSLLKSVKT